MSHKSELKRRVSQGDPIAKDAARYRWICARFDADTDEDTELFSDTMNKPDRDAAIDAAMDVRAKP